MKGKRLVIIIAIIISIVIGLIIINITKKEKEIKHIKTSFNKEYNIKEEKLGNKNNFNYKATIYSNDKIKKLTCVNVILYDDNNNALLSYNEYVNMYVSKDGGYPISINNDKALDVASVKYELCE